MDENPTKHKKKNHDCIESWMKIRRREERKTHINSRRCMKKTSKANASFSVSCTHYSHFIYLSMNFRLSCCSALRKNASISPKDGMSLPLSKGGALKDRVWLRQDLRDLDIDSRGSTLRTLLSGVLSSWIPLLCCLLGYYR